MGDYVGTKVKSKEWGVTPGTISAWCRKGKIPGAEQDEVGSPWRIPKDAKRPK